MRVLKWMSFLLWMSQAMANGSDWQHVKDIKKTKKEPQKMEEDTEKRLKKEEEKRRENQRQLERLLEHEARYPHNL